MSLLSQLLICIIILLSSSTLSAQQEWNSAETSRSTADFRMAAELGYLGVLDHQIQLSRDGTNFDYRSQGGQDVLFPVSRFSFEFDWNPRNTLVFLYQPLRLETQVLLDEDLVVDGETFEAGKGIDLLYNFPFYRVSYLRNVALKNPKYSFSYGASLQLRNATISFASLDGEKFRSNRDLGPVPILKVRGRVQLNERYFAETEIDGIYAPISYLNGSDNEVKGAILDASIRGGVKVSQPVSAFLNLRYIGGGAVGDSEDEEGPGDGYVKNWLHFGFVTAGVVYEW